MSGRLPLVIRGAVREDAAALIALWDECATVSPDDAGEALTQQAMWRKPSVAEAAEAIELNLSRPEKRILVALVEGEIVGAAVCDLQTLNPISLTRVLLITDLQVRARFRRHAVASALLSAAAAYGEDAHCEIVLAMVATQARESARFLAKIGFNQVAIVRAIQASKLRSRLAGKATNSAQTGKLIAMRRTLRRRHADPDLRPRA